jgi:hypothetical protein
MNEGQEAIKELEDLVNQMGQSFENRIRTSGFDVPVPAKKWFYISFINKPEGKFQGAALVEAEHWGKAIDAVFELKLKPKDAKCELTIEIPGDKVPPEEYRNRLLSREEIEAIWPQVKES